MSNKINQGDLFKVMTEGEFSSYDIEVGTCDYFILRDYDAGGSHTEGGSTYHYGGVLNRATEPEADNAGVGDGPGGPDTALFGVGIVGSTLQGTPAAGTAGDHVLYIWCYNGAPTSLLYEDQFNTPEVVAVLKVHVRVLGDDVQAATPIEPGSFDFNSAYCLKTLVTNKDTWNLGGGIAAPTLPNLSANLNDFFVTNNYPITSAIVDGKLQLTFTDGSTLESAALCDDSALTITTIQEPIVIEANNAFFGKDNPADEEYSWYTIVNTCACAPASE